MAAPKKSKASDNTTAPTGTKALVDKLRSDYGILTAQEKQQYDYREFRNSGSAVINYILHGGFAVGRVIEILGNEQSGKTVLALISAIDMINNTDKSVLYFDLEQSLDAEWYNALGGDFEKHVSEDRLFIVDNTNSEIVAAEDIYNFADKAIRTGHFGMVILDSMDAMQTRYVKSVITGKNEEMSIESRARDDKAKLNSAFFRSIIRPLTVNRCSMLIINQYRSTMATNPWEPTKVGGGGLALPYYAQQRLTLHKKNRAVLTRKDIEDGFTKDDAAEALAFEISATVIKNKYGSPFGNEAVPTFFWSREVNIADESSIYYGHHKPGFDNALGAIYIGKLERLIERSGAWLSYQPIKGDVIKAQGEGKFAVAIAKAGLVDEIVARSIANSLELRGDPIDIGATGFSVTT